jgi:DNA-binding winged helix-turn-helix (wHTH) protein
MCPFTHRSQGADTPEKTPSYPFDMPALTTTDLAILKALAENYGRVVGREYLMRTAGLDGSAPRRVDASLVVLRKTLGPDAVVSVRRRGWMLTEDGYREATAILSSSV